MVVSSRPRFLDWIVGLILAALLPGSAFADEPRAQRDLPQKAPLPDQSNRDDLPAPFVPLHPRSAEEREQIEALRQFVTARSLEDQGKLAEAIELLEQAREKDPDSVAILKRLGRINRALGRIEESVAISRKILELEPGDTSSIWLIVAYSLEVKKDPKAAAAFLENLSKNEKLDPNSAGAILANRILGDIEAEFLAAPDKAAAAYAKVVDALDEKAASRISPNDMRRILRDNEAESYLRFGEVFLRAKQFDNAVRAFQRGLTIDPENSQIPRFLADALLKAGKPAQALAAMDDYLRRQPQGREPYELLAEILHTLGRDPEITPRLEAAAQADPKNISLQFALVERYRKEGKNDRADALLADLLKKQGDPQIFGPLAASLLKERKTEELVKVIRDALGKPGGPQAVGPQVEAIAQDREYADEVLALALKSLETDPQSFSDDARKIFAYIATKAEKPDRLIALDRLAVKLDPDPQNYRELVVDLFRNGHYDEAADATRQLLDKYPNERTAPIFGILARSLFFSGKIEPALEAAREAEKQNPNDQEILFLIGFLLGRANRNPDAINHYRKILARFPEDEEVTKRAHLGLSAVYVGMEDFDKGVEELEIVLAKDPDDPQVNNDLGYLYADRGMKLDQAETMIRKALEEEPENTAYLDSLGWVLYRQGRFREALEPLEQAAQENSVDATILDHLGDVYYRLQRYQKARDSWKSAEELAAKSDPPDKRLPAIRQKLQELQRLMSSGPEPAANRL